MHSAEDLISLVAGELSAATLASRHGVSEEEVLRWRAAYLAGMRTAAGVAAATRRPRLGRWAILGAVVFTTAAFAQLVTFQPNAPALASEVNGNFTQLKTWLEAKVGAVTSAGITASAVTASTVTGTTVSATRLVTGVIPLQYGDWSAVNGSFPTTAGIVNDNASYKALMVVGNNSNGGVRRVQLYDDVLVGRDLAVTRDLSCPSNSWGSGPTAQTAIDRSPCTFPVGQRCPNGQYVCGLSFNHGCSANWWQETVTLECCSL